MRLPSLLLHTLTVAGCAGALALAGCGDDDSTPAGSATAESTQAATSGASETASIDGKAVFTGNCSSCHTLKDAGTSGTFGPNLDELKPDAATVENQVTNGGGGMPAFGDKLSADEIKAVSTYVATATGG